MTQAPGYICVCISTSEVATPNAGRGMEDASREGRSQVRSRAGPLD